MYCTICKKNAPTVAWEKKTDAPTLVCDPCSGDVEYDLMLSGWEPKILDKAATGFSGMLEFAEEFAILSPFQELAPIIAEVKGHGIVYISENGIRVSGINITKLSVEKTRRGKEIEIIAINVLPASYEIDGNEIKFGESFIILFDPEAKKITHQFDIINASQAEVLQHFVANHIRTKLNA